MTYHNDATNPPFEVGQRVQQNLARMTAYKTVTGKLYAPGIHTITKVTLMPGCHKSTWSISTDLYERQCKKIGSMSQSMTSYFFEPILPGEEGEI